MATFPIAGTPMPNQILQPSFRDTIVQVARRFGWTSATIIPGFASYRFLSSPVGTQYQLAPKRLPDNAVLVKLGNAGFPNNQYAYVPSDKLGNLHITNMGDVEYDPPSIEPAVVAPVGWPPTNDLRYGNEWLGQVLTAIARTHQYVAVQLLPNVERVLWRRELPYPVARPVFNSRGHFTAMFQSSDQRWWTVYISTTDLQPTMYQINPGASPQLQEVGGGSVNFATRYSLEAVARSLMCDFIQVWLGQPWEMYNERYPPNTVPESLNHLYVQKAFNFTEPSKGARYVDSQNELVKNTEWPEGVTMQLRKPTDITRAFWPKGTWDNSITLERRDFNTRFYLISLASDAHSPQHTWMQAIVPIDINGVVNADGLQWIDLANDPFVNIKFEWANPQEASIRVSQVVAAVGKTANMDEAYIRAGVHDTTSYNDQYVKDPWGNHITVFFKSSTMPSTLYPAHIYVDNEVTVNFQFVIWFFPDTRRGGNPRNVQANSYWV